MYKFLNRTFIAVVATAFLTSCNKLSDQAMEIVGTYYNTELSQTEPVMELRPDATCLIRAIRPGVLTYSVEGEWNVENDSLVIILQPETLKWKGDSVMIGEIPLRNARKIANHSDFSLQLEQGGATYVFKRQATH